MQLVATILDATRLDVKLLLFKDAIAPLRFTPIKDHITDLKMSSNLY